ncbi:HlyD family efflux transporter periplasmic adaptor subunit [Herbaspirillum sp. LeCh32-8]|uniref:HlyD family secretion protein n=1 Tax=Herbaspirillum sp. LeCh32-8 TaxID=2821356 RepID=UPI001AE4E565|nr:biotin/lipoyl-binding protein [Herbaspirillum sp. LeCh32-8]MBP0597889.1 HlyD family efflux transporter periplasmic adaptor subunit [Herbaspirillum sp. LeCh32-8]
MAGSIRLARPLAGWLIVAASLVAVATIGMFVACGSVTRKAHIAGVIVPIDGSATVAAATAGVLKRIYVREGDAVAAEEPLFELATERQGKEGELSELIAQQLATRQASLESERRLRQSQYRDKTQNIRERQQNLGAETDKLEQEIALARRREELARQTLSKYEVLQQSGYVSHAQLQQKQEDLLDVTGKLNALERSKVQLSANRIALKSELASTETELATDLAQIERSLASLRQESAENHSRHSTLITAPQAGTITAISYQSGQTVAPGQMLATLIPLHAGDRPAASPTLEAHLYATSRTAGFVDAGQKVAIRYDAYPYQKFGLQQGTVVDVSRTPFAPSELPANLASTIIGQSQQLVATASAAPTEALYRIKVRLNRQAIDAYGQPKQLKAGMTLSADVKQDRRAIWEWVAEPLLAVARTE